MNAQVAYSSGRAFVYDNYTWNRDNTEYSEFSGKPIPSQIPLSALISGPLIGGPFVLGDETPLSVHKEYFDEICPHPTIVDTRIVAQLIGDDQASAKRILDAWTGYLRGIDDPCVEIARDSDRIFDYYIYGQKARLLSIWPVLSESPTLRLLGWSPLIHAAFDVNRHLFAPIQPLDPLPIPTSLEPLRDPYASIPGLLVLHIRRGDFEDHCTHLAQWGAAFNGFNSFPELPDQWTTPPGTWKGETTEENLQFYLRRCFPSIPQIVEKVEEVRSSRAGQGLKNIYVMTNAKARWASQLKTALRKKGGWETIATSRELDLTREQKYVAQAVDMLIGQRAQVLIGNGFSSLTSDIVMLRMARPLSPDSTRFW
ncbi:hypothetical protein PHLGIDRAFT_25752 [Phlebiopsis gigantea 11061_1 CR5-6]|uniref:Uncharacterized protein n=1 Tax=Phlebiopsis gigantea (strain 11061_1 CR5-6) TaxID=745531 RepID=A0A0C3NH72_PHLG1|nr:hypothetical protein PHLGIDRAFT_25752 [Phlebiopsis gigantea 11061_1 CR5-6]